MPAGRKGKAKSTAAALPVEIEEEDEKEFSCGEEAESPRGRSHSQHNFYHGPCPHILSCIYSEPEASTFIMYCIVCTPILFLKGMISKEG